MWFRIISLWLLSFLRPINVIAKTTYNCQSYNSPNSIILVYSAGLQFHLFLCFSPLMIALSQPLTSFYFLWVLCSYLLRFFRYLLCWLRPARWLRGFALWFFHYLLWVLCNLLWFFHYFCHFISIFCLYNTQDCSQS